MSKKNDHIIWIISEIYYPEDTGTGHFLTHIAEGLAGRFLVNVICGRPNYAKRGTSVAARELRNGVRIFRFCATTLDRNVWIFRAINVFTSTVMLVAQVLWRVRAGDTVMVGTNPPTLPIFVTVICRLKRGRMVLRLDDLYPDALVMSGLVKAGSVWVVLHNGLNRWIYRRADKIITVGRDMMKVVKDRSRPVHHSVVYIPNWADIDSVRPKSREESPLWSELGLGQKLVVGYAGNMGPLQAIEHLAACAERMLTHGDVHFVFVGSGKMAHWLTAAIRDRRLTNITLLGQRPREEQSDFLSACDIGIVSLVAGMSGVGVPSRSYNMMAAGRPILASVDLDSEVAMMVREENIGWVIPPGDIDAFVAALIQAKEDRQQLRAMGLRSRRAAEERYSRDAIVEKYVELFSRSGY